MASAKQKIIESLLTQKDLYGDELFRKTLIAAPVLPEKKDVAHKAIKKISSPTKANEPDPGQKSDESGNATEKLEQFYKEICECMECPLGKTRNKFVYGVGNPNARVMLVGEGPGADEDAQGIPFVGRAGQLLTKILEAISFKREEVYIANIVKCRPPGNRTPNPVEIETCIPYLYKQIEIIQPKLILCLGTTAAVSLLKRKESLGAMRNKVHQIGEIKAVVTYHPAALLRNPNWKKDCWADVQFFRKLYDEMYS
ncbi:MAG: uracil-DNA glycosylase [Ignavibacteriaceae bacterium]|jgi:DNA polymerase